jgi:putative transposase
VIVTDKLAGYQVAHRELLASVTHRRSKYLNNREAQRFLFAFIHIRQHFRPRRHLMSAPQWRTEMTARFAVWDEIIAAKAA